MTNYEKLLKRSYLREKWYLDKIEQAVCVGVGLVGVAVVSWLAQGFLR